MNKTSFMKKNNGKKFIRYIDNYQGKEDIYKSLLPIAIKECIPLEWDEEEQRWSLDGVLYRHDQRQQEEEVIITFRSNDYIADNGVVKCYGDIPKAAHFSENSFYFIDYYGNKITYTLV